MNKRLNKFWPFSLFVILLFALGISVQAQTNPSASRFTSDNTQAWLVKMAKAVSSLNYQISFVVLKPGADALPYLWRHGVTEEGVEMEQMNLLNGPGREVLRVGDQVSYFEPTIPPYSLRSSIINGPLPMAFLRDPIQLAASYDFITVGRSRVSGRAAQQIRVVSKDKSRFGFNLWLDQETGLILKFNMVDLQGQLLEQMQVTELQVSDNMHPYFERVEVAKLPDVIALPETAASPRQWEIGFLPQGMEAIKWDVHRLPITGDVVEYVMLSDGLVDVSVYLQNTPNQNNNDLVLRHESNTFLTRQQGQLLVTVIGKLPPQTADAIASSVKLVN